MSLSNIKIIILIISVFIVSLLTINYLTPDYHPDGGLKLKLSKDEISGIGNKIVESYRPELKDEKRNLSLESNPAILRWLRSTNRIDSANRKIREQNLSYFWLLKVLSVNDTNLLITSDKNQNIETSTVLELKFSQEGKLIAISEVFNETKITNYLSEDSAKSFLERQISSLADYISFTNDSQKINFGTYLFTLDKIELIQKLNRKDYNFVWKGYDDSGHLIFLKASIIGDKLKSFELVVPVPDEYSKSDPDIYEIVTTIFLLLFVLIMVIVIGLKRIKAYEIGYKNAILFASVYTFFFFTGSNSLS